ncbi:peptidoglycan-binding domain-containing protein [Promicromonospora iranensis]|uniref:Peptidoglycan binding-like domain-containing protein n=1 Tax=Promicromonospora iranensis TaxID=1105144 RepID=A0ABU2CKZ9_9MICO|nr:peptidoglycan-binding domain-containing protein [Promicromonospora iranensis]MDR7382019.1 hypothetical protein [Promicromonospora iranensis]
MGAVAFAAPASAAAGYCNNYASLDGTGGWVYRVPVQSVSGGYHETCYMAPSTSYNKGAEQLQRSLKHCYLSHIPSAWRASFVDGYYGGRTSEVLASVQSASGVSGDGLYGPNTRRAIKWPAFSQASGSFTGNCYRTAISVP